MKKLLLFLLVFLSFVFLPQLSLAQVWTQVGTGSNAIHPNLMFTLHADKYGNIYTGFFDTDNYYQVYKWDGNLWSKLGTVSTALNANDYIYTICSDKDGNIYAAGKFKDSGSLYVAKWNGLSWTKLGNNLGSFNFNEINSMIIDSFGNIYVAGDFPTVLKWDGINWSQVGIGSSSLNANLEIYSIVLDKYNNLYAAGAFTDIVGFAYVAKWNGSNWSKLGNGNNSLKPVVYIDWLSADGFGNIYAASGNSFFHFIEEWNGSTWKDIGANFYLSDLSAMSADVYGNVYVAANILGYYIFKWNRYNWTQIGDSIGSYVYSICIAPNKNIYTAGEFYSVLQYTPPNSNYCNSYAVEGIFDTSDIGRFTIGTDTFGSLYSHLAYPAAVSTYTFNYSDTIQLKIDSTYHLQEAGIMNTLHDADAKVTLFIDYNANGQFDIPNERVWTAYAKAFQYYILDTDITISAAAVTNYPVSMRLIINNDTGASAASDSACGTYVSGETEDFVVIFRNATSFIQNTINPHNKIKIYPNPVQNVLHIEGIEKGTAIKLYNIIGQQLYLNSSSPSERPGEVFINTNQYSPGTYILELTSPDGSRVVRKIIK